MEANENTTLYDEGSNPPTRTQEVHGLIGMTLRGGARFYMLAGELGRVLKSTQKKELHTHT